MTACTKIGLDYARLILILLSFFDPVKRHFFVYSWVVTALLLSVGVTSCGENQPIANPGVTPVATPPATEAESAGRSPNVSPKIKVVTTFLPIYWFTKSVAGDRAEIEILVPPGTDIHDYQATPANVQAIAQADVVIKNGLGLESFLDATLKNASNPRLKLINSSQGIETLKDTKTDDRGHNHDHAEGNPHIWLDPVRVKQQVMNIRDGLMSADPANRSTYEANAAATLEKLDRLHQDFQTRLKPHQGCTYVTFHDAYPYLAQRYQLKQVAVVSLPEDSLKPSDIQKAVQTVQKYQVKTLLGEPGTDQKLLDSLAQDLKLTLRPIDPLETGPEDPQHYFTTMGENLNVLVAACQPQS